MTVESEREIETVIVIASISRLESHGTQRKILTCTILRTDIMHNEPIKTQRLLVNNILEHALVCLLF